MDNPPQRVFRRGESGNVSSEAEPNHERRYRDAPDQQDNVDAVKSRISALSIGPPSAHVLHPPRVYSVDFAGRLYKHLGKKNICCRRRRDSVLRALESNFFYFFLYISENAATP